MSLESIFAGIEQAHAQKLARAREAYVALVRRLHQSPDALDDEPEILVEVLNEVGKTPAGLKADVALYARLRRLAALAARHAPASEEYDQVRAERDALREEWKSIEAEWAERFRVVDSKVSRLQTEFRHAIEAEHDLVVHQHAGVEQRELERQGRHAEARALGERAHRLELLARAFFPPPAPEEPGVVRSEGCSWRAWASSRDRAALGAAREAGALRADAHGTAAVPRGPGGRPARSLGATPDSASDLAGCPALDGRDSTAPRGGLRRAWLRSDTACKVRSKEVRLAAKGPTRWKVGISSPRSACSRERSLYLRGRRRRTDGSWEERRVSTGSMDRAKAEQLRAVFEASLNANVDGDLADPRFLSLFDMRIAALEADPEVADNTVQSYEAARKALAVTGLAKTPASELTRGVVKRAQAELQRGEGQPRRASTVNLYVSLAQAAWRWALDMELVEVDWPHVRRLKTKRTEKRPFTDAEVAAILGWLEGYLGGKWLPLFSLLADSSARISAVLNLRGRDVNRAACEVTFRKTKTEWRTVAIPPGTIALLPEADPQALLFPGTKPGRPFRPESVRDVLIRAMKAVGI